MKLTERERIIVLLLPVTVVLFGYAWWFSFVVRPKFAAARAAYDRAYAARVSLADLTAQQRRNAAIKGEVQALEKQKEGLDIQADEVCGHTVEPLRRIRAERELTELFHRHDVQLVANGPAVGSGDANLPKSLTEAMERSEARPHDRGGQVRAMHLVGRYMDVLDAVGELASAETSPVIPVSLTMAEADLSVEDRQWTLLIWM